MPATPDRSTLAASEIQAIIQATAMERLLEGKNRVTALDRYDTPFLNSIRTSMAGGRATPTRGAYKAYVKGNRNTPFQAWSGRDLLTFTIEETIFDLQYAIGRVHLGTELIHQKLEEAGIKVEYDTSVGKIPKMSSGAWEIIYNIVDEYLEDAEADYTRQLAYAVWQSNATDPKMFGGIDSLFPTTSNSTGLIGGKSRSNPLLRHQLATGVATADLETTIQAVVRAANRRQKASGVKVNVAYCGDNMYDALTSLLFTGATAKYDRNLAADQAREWAGRLGIGIPDDALMIPNVGVLTIESTFEDLDTLESPSIAWSDRLYLLAMKSLFFKAPRDNEVTPHPVPYNQRVTRISHHGEYAMGCTVPGANGVVCI